VPFTGVNGIRTCFSIEGKGDPVVFVHGLGLDSRIWDDQVESIPESYETLVYDLRGHGESDAPETGYSYKHYADDFGTLISECVSLPVHIVGLSMGGAIAFKYTREHPEHVRSLTLVGTHISGYTAFENWPNLHKVSRSDGPDAAREMWKSFRLFASVKSDENRWNKLCGIVDRFSCAPWLDPNPRYNDDDDFANTEEVVVPTLIASGTLDPDFRPISEHLALKLPDARFESFNCGHLVNFELPGEFNEALRAFLGEVL
jgi:pimeloyl-ACP methyl ester carboxylesterase